LNKLFKQNTNFITMGNILYLIAVILVIIWAISFFGGYATGGIIHILLVIAIIVVLLRIIRGNA
jgi:tryptophan-rich sensory protein